LISVTGRPSRSIERMNAVPMFMCRDRRSESASPAHRTQYPPPPISAKHGTIEREYAIQALIFCYCRSGNEEHGPTDGKATICCQSRRFPAKCVMQHGQRRGNGGAVAKCWRPVWATLRRPIRCPHLWVEPPN
jgi:hypothetical protein